MVMIRKKVLLRRATVVGLAFVLSAPFSKGELLESRMSPQAMSQPTNAAAQFTGTWHWMCKGKSAVTMILSPSGAGFTGSVTAIEGIQLDTDGTVLRIDPGDGTTPILNASLDGSVLHFETKDGDDETEWTVTLKDSGNAEVRGVETGRPGHEANSG